MAQYRALEVVGKDGKALTLEPRDRRSGFELEPLDEDLAALDSLKAAAAAQLGAEAPAEADPLAGLLDGLLG